MRIILLGHRDLASNLALSLLVQGLATHTLKIYLSGSVVSDANLPQPLHELAAVDRGFCAVLNKDTVQGIMGFDALAHATGRPVNDLVRPNSPASLTELREFNPDLIVSVRYRRILRQQVIDLPRLGVLNLHSGLLPDYQGVMATFWAMLHNAQEIGSTVHYIEDSSIDTGAMVSLQPQFLRPDRSYLANVLSLYPSGCRAMLESIHRLETGVQLATRVKVPGGKYYSFPTHEQIAKFLGDGHIFSTSRELDDLSVLLASGRSGP